jgi:hypothetical protein
MTAETATLIAAGLAAVVSILNLLLTGTFRKQEEMRGAIRSAAAANHDDIGRLVHEVIALSYVLSKVNSDQAHKEKHEKAREAADKLKSKRLDVRYSLWGIEEGLRTLTRVPDWIAHTRVDVPRREKLLAAAKELGEVVDDVVRKTYLTGAVPGRFSRWRVQRKAANAKTIFDSFINNKT